MESDQARRLLAKYVPEIRLHSRERYFPTNAETFLDVAGLLKLTPRRKPESGGPPMREALFESGELNRENLMAAATGAAEAPQGDKHELQLVLHERHRTRAALEALPDVPIYGHVREVRLLDENGEPRGELVALEVVYAFFFMFNGNLRAAKVVPVGSHTADWEHLTMRLDPTGEHLQGIYYSAHRTIDGDWVPASKIPMSKGRPVAYCALNGHGCFPKPGIQPRIFFLVNDRCDGKGPVWRPQKVVLLGSLPPKADPVASRGSALPKNQRLAAARGSTDDTDEAVEIDENVPYWVDFDEWWGTVRNPCHQKWFKKAENPVSRGWFRRVFFPTCFDPPEAI
ncbi:unnamed protein product [Ostreobium quekettii]|uniref:Uncharacterized protein n=1 Tax=Ostreobium quekettii TaxID=121088 RepID=A0A8S1J1L8_9CHLO|nr:unnamed protein product [Ostreobium quekettii]|eukprot:evm.model.scf_258.5 EVM.evm.TU.scf_258.5   scf_258:64551-69288(-)